MKHLRDLFVNMSVLQVTILVAVLAASYLAVFVTGAYLIRGYDIAEINAANQRIGHLNMRLKAALEDDAPKLCPAPPAHAT